jgi:hypothetical protein
MSWSEGPNRANPTADRHYRAFRIDGAYGADGTDGPDAHLLRDALAVLRPGLATIWVDTAGDRPTELATAAAEAARIAGEQARAGRPRRSEAPPSTAALDAADDAQFALALALAPGSARVEAMSSDGRLVLAHRDASPLRLRLTVEQRDALRGSGRLVATRPPRPGAKDTGLTFATVLATIGVVRFLGMTIDDLRSHPHGAGLLLVAAELTGVAVLVVAGAVTGWRWLRDRPWPVLTDRFRRPPA